MKHLAHSTPARRDKRLAVTLVTNALLAVLAVAKVISGDAAATGITSTSALYLVQSQMGVTMRARAEAAAAPKEG